VQGVSGPGEAEPADGGGSPRPDGALSGVITGVDRGAGAARVTVEVSGAGASSERAVLLAVPGTEIAVLGTDGASRPGDVLDLVPGARIEARHTGAELRSLPPQYHATRIRVLAGP
jgi:hypothetical protein